jgi:tetratricopeptide (TPR) repeat protein
VEISARARGRQEETLGNKPNNIRKKALEHAKKGHWEKALEEFLRLVEVEQHNPNLFNEIGDIQLKLANKREAFKQYDAAIEAYAKVGLLNNAIAVCKKILRLNPADDIVYGRMATLRQSQGFGREAAAYALQFLERLMKRPEGADESAMAIVREIVRQVSPEPEVLERAAECFTAWDASGDAADALEKLERVSHERGLSAHAERARAKLRSMGRERTAPVAPAPESRPADSGPREPADHRGAPTFRRCGGSRVRRAVQQNGSLAYPPGSWRRCGGGFRRDRGRIPKHERTRGEPGADRGFQRRRAERRRSGGRGNRTPDRTRPGRPRG